MLRTFFLTDLAQLLTVERAAHIAPWTEETFMACFQSGYVGWVMEVDQRLIGFVIIAQQVSDCHILNLCVHPDYQHKGYGSQLLIQALTHATNQGISIAYLEVRRSNAHAISLYEKLGFKQVGERKNYYPSSAGHEDALILAKYLNPSLHQ